MLPATLVTLAAMSLLAPATLADVLEVDAFGGGDFLTVQEAIDAAHDGDIILVDGSSPQPAFTIDGKGVDVIADTPGTVSVFGGNIRIQNLAAGQSVTIANFASFGDPLDSLPGGEPLRRHGLVVRQAFGPVRVVNCRFRGADSLLILDENTPLPLQGNPDGGAGAVVTAVDIAFVRCRLAGGKSADLTGDLLSQGPCYCLTPFHNGGDGLRALNSNVSLYNVDLIGGVGRDGEDTGASGGHGMILLGKGSLFASDCDFQGGPGGSAYDYIFSVGGDGGHGVFTPQGTAARFLDCTYSGAPGGYGFAGSNGTDGQPRKVNGVLVDHPGIAHSMYFPGPVREQQLAPFTFFGHPGDQVYVLYGLGEGSLYVPDLSGQLHVGVPWLDLLYVATLPESGSLQIAVPVPELGPGIEGVSFRVQTLFVNGLLDHAVLGVWAPLLLLDDSL